MGTPDNDKVVTTPAELKIVFKFLRLLGWFTHTDNFQLSYCWLFNFTFMLCAEIVFGVVGLYFTVVYLKSSLIYLEVVSFSFALVGYIATKIEWVRQIKNIKRLIGNITELQGPCLDITGVRYRVLLSIMEIIVCFSVDFYLMPKSWIVHTITIYFTNIIISSECIVLAYETLLEIIQNHFKEISKSLLHNTSVLSACVLHEFTKQHFNVSRLLEQFENIFSFLIFIILLQVSFYGIVIIYFLMKNVRTDSKGFAWLQLSWVIANFRIFFRVVHASVQVTREGTKFQRHLLYVLNDLQFPSDAAKLELRMYATSKIVTGNKAAGFIALDYSTLLTVVAAIASYLLIVINLIPLSENTAYFHYNHPGNESY